MAEFETDVETIVEDDTFIEDDTQDDTETELTVEDYQKEKARREKAEKTLVELKKQLKDKSTLGETGITPEDLDLRDEVAEFLIDNPDLREYKADILKHRKAGYSIKQAKALIEADDKTIENRAKMKAMNVTAGEDSAKKTSYTKAEFEKLDWDEYDRVANLVKAGKIKLK